MSESTVYKPRPGARQPLPRPEPGTHSGDKTELESKRPRPAQERFRIPATHLGPVCDHASKLLSLAGRLADTREVDDVANLKRQCTALVREYQQALRSDGLLPATVDTASYCTCALLDELVLNSEWGQSGHWAASSLLSEFHSQTWAGTHFFELVDAARRQADVEMLTLQYLCLSLGFKGKYRIENGGAEYLDILQESLYQQICASQSRLTTPFDRDWQQRVAPGRSLAQGVPLWAGAAVCSVVMLLAFLGLSHNLSSASLPILEELAHVGLPSAAEADGGSMADTRYLQQILQTEVERGLVELKVAGERVELLMGSEALFSSGAADLREDIMPVLAKISRVLESTAGSIQVIGHTDDQPIATSRYPSNWHLSLARATAVADLLAATADLNGRLWPEGRGAAEPRYANDSDENRARNRRVEITLVPGTLGKL